MSPEPTVTVWMGEDVEPDNVREDALLFPMNMHDNPKAPVRSFRVFWMGKLSALVLHHEIGIDRR
ncbi:hypothetical protein M948_01660 [Virgibacillus sp. CM-4]|nr:hypothetical protein M948_01660 [Virgibacillus sp. CM-4]